MPSDPSSDRHKRMIQIRDEVINFKESPLYSYRIENNYHAVIGEGSNTAQVMFVGEAPGKNEAESGRPFCGAAGRMLEELLASINLKREDVYITNIVKDRPPENRDPEPEEIALYAPFLDRQVDVIQPKVIAALGRFSANYIMCRFGLQDKVTKISQMHGQKYTARRDWGKVDIVPLYHPAVALYRNSMKEVLIHDFNMVDTLIRSESVGVSE